MVMPVLGRMRLVFLGTGGSYPTKERNVSGIALRMNGEVLLLDCAEGSQRQLAFTDVSFMKISTILVTHFHGDHFLGLPFAEHVGAAADNVGGKGLDSDFFHPLFGDDQAAAHRQGRGPGRR